MYYWISLRVEHYTTQHNNIAREKRRNCTASVLRRFLVIIKLLLILSHFALTPSHKAFTHKWRAWPLPFVVIINWKEFRYLITIIMECLFFQPSLAHPDLSFPLASSRFFWQDSIGSHCCCSWLVLFFFFSTAAAADITVKYELAAAGRGGGGNFHRRTRHRLSCQERRRQRSSEGGRKDGSTQWTQSHTSGQLTPANETAAAAATHVIHLSLRGVFSKIFSFSSHCASFLPFDVDVRSQRKIRLRAKGRTKPPTQPPQPQH